MSQRKTCRIEALESRLLMAVLPVTNLLSDGPGSLRATVAAAQNGDTVDLRQLSGTITLTSYIDVFKNISIVGPGRDMLTVSGGGKTRMLYVHDGANASVSDVTFANGGGYYSYLGGAIFCDGVLALERVTLENNEARGDGGAVSVSSGDLTATDCIFRNNVAGLTGGGLEFLWGNLKLQRCTFTGNRAGGAQTYPNDSGYGYGGGLYIGGANGSIVNCTIDNNIAAGSTTMSGYAFGGGLAFASTNVNGAISIVNCTITDNLQVWIKGDQVRAIRNGVIKNFPLASVKEVQILGFDGNDTLSVNTRAIPAYVVGGAGNDTILGGDEADNFVGGGGKDVLDSGGGNDRLDGGAGNDKLLGGLGDDRLIGNDGNDVLIGGDGMDQFFGGNGDDALYSRDSFIDVLSGCDGNDSVQLDPLDIKADLLALLP